MRSCSRHRRLRWIALAGVTAVASASCGLPEEDFREGGELLEAEIPEIAEDLPGNFEIVDDLEERDCSSEPLGQNAYDHSEYRFELVSPADPDLTAWEVLDQAEEVFSDHGWDLAGRYDDRLRAMFAREVTDDFSLTVHVLNEELDGENVVILRLVTSCMEHRDTPREPLEFSLDLPEHDDAD